MQGRGGKAAKVRQKLLHQLVGHADDESTGATSRTGNNDIVRVCKAPQMRVTQEKRDMLRIDADI